MSWLDTEIDRVSAALARHEHRIDDMNRQWSNAGGLCCPGCMFGAEFTQAANKCERVAYWLCILLLKRASALDLRRVELLAFDLPSEDRKRIEPRLRQRRGHTEGAEAPAVR